MEKNHLKKYRLIREYPGSYKLGTEVIYSEKYQIYNHNGGNFYTELPKNQVENLPEFWEEVVEKDYEILSYIDKSTKNVLSAKLDPFVNNKLIEWKDKNLDIHSIKRLSDGEVFAIEDIIESAKKLPFNTRHAILEFKIDSISNDNLYIVLDNYNKSTYSTKWSFDKFKKAKQPLFITEDGVDIFEGDILYYVETEEGPELCFIVNKYTALKYSSRFNSDKSLHSFSTKEAAEEYILMNKPCLSLNDLKPWGDLLVNNLVKLVKEKINEK